MILVTTMIGSLIVGLTSCGKKKQNYEYQRDIISYYGIDSDENNTIEYMKLAEEIEDLDLKNNKDLSDANKEKLGIPNYLLEPSKIKDLMENYNSTIIFSNEDLDKILSDVKTLSNMITQKNLLLDFADNKAYDLVYKEFTATLKSLAAQIYSINDRYIKLYAEVDKSTGTDQYAMYHSDEPFEGIYGANRVPVYDNTIIDGIELMCELDKVKDSNYKEQFIVLCGALSKSAEYNKYLDNNTYNIRK